MVQIGKETTRAHKYHFKLGSVDYKVNIIEHSYTFWVDIGDQIPILGEDPEIKENPILFGIDWLSLNEICERDRAYIWAAGLLSIKEFADELITWDDDISYPSYKTYKK
ncbi:hypothetical protein [Oceanirhabdus sp. W0125-5]|uniref:hypothetical protein n=1 Tax=Oceanirhabdus sp. W0125-5 TaxID=2999116 RepID=UPI0022F33401|nr:hypothetical protein [Oceanirhabdus sp. W0125-5]WBW94993.1 hypothetical protein OW730_14980 [Oceanirhabdus sp. W0125-5]